jgi:AraC-like DNA-binding protein
MISGVKAMIAGCIEKMSRGACGGCEKRDACAELFKAFRFGRPQMRRRERPAATLQPFLAFLGQIATAIEARPRPSPFRREVERRLEPLLAEGTVRIDRVARELGYSRQTLYRRLKAEGVTFERLLDDLRRRLALRYLRDQGLSVKESAYRLGFSDPAAFSRAFKRWTGTSPGAMRATARPH